MSRVAPRLILGSSSPQRIELLRQIEIIPNLIQPADIDETPRKGEKADQYCLRMALEKNAALAEQFPNDFILTGDTICVVGTRIIGKAGNAEEQKKFLRLFSGRSHRVVSAIALRNSQGKVSSRLSSTRVTVKRLSEEEIAFYIAHPDWQGRSGYRFSGVFSRYITKVQGSVSGIIGLPLYETMQLLNGSGYKINTGI